MARIRSVKPELFHHEGLASCSPHARLLFIAMLQLADRRGRFRWLPMQVHAHAFPYEPELSVHDLAEELRGIGCVQVYRAGEKRYVDILNFTKHQRVPNSEKPSTAPEPAEKTLTTFVKHDVAQSLTPCSTKLPLEVWRDGNGKGEEGSMEVGKNKKPVLEAGEPISRVWNMYRRYHPKSRTEPTESWRVLIEKALEEHSAEDLCLTVRWAKEAQAYSFQRSKGHDKLNNILAATKLPGRVEAALEWAGISSSLEGWLEHNAKAALRYMDEAKQYGADMAPGSLIHYMSEYGLPQPSPDVEAKVINWLISRGSM